MPPKPKYTRDELILASLAIVSEQGVNALTARELAKRMHCSTRPIFTLFGDMDELKREVRRVVAIKVEKICFHAMLESNDFSKALLEAVRFSKREPNLYALVFMTGNSQHGDFVGLLEDNEVREGDYIQFLQKAYNISEWEARWLFRHSWVHCLGMGVLSSTQRFLFSDNTIEQLVRADLDSAVHYIKQVFRSEEGGVMPPTLRQVLSTGRWLAPSSFRRFKPQY